MLLKRTPGGLALSVTIMGTIMAATTGIIGASVVMMSLLALPVMLQRGYQVQLATGTIAASATLGILIPPSIMLVIMADLLSISVGTLFLAAVFPGLLLAVLYLVYIYVRTRLNPSLAPPLPDSLGPDTKAELYIMVIRSFVPPIALIGFVLGSIFAGWATPTEAAAFGVTGALILALINNSGPPIAGWFLKKLNASGSTTSTIARWQERYPQVDGHMRESMSINIDMIKDSVLSTVRTSSMIMLIVIAAFTLSFAFARLGISHDISQWIINMDLSSTELVIVLVIFYLLLGTFMESFAMLVTTVPILAPALVATGVDLVWFGIIMVILVEAALISPPEGINLYVLHGVRRDVQTEMNEAAGAAEEIGTITDVYIGVLPFMAVMASIIVLLIIFPDIALWLPDQVKGSR